MKRERIRVLCFYLSILVFALVNGCVSKAVKKPKHMLNIDLIAESIKKITLPLGGFKKGDKVAIVSIEKGFSSDFPVNYLIEDQIVEKLYKEGARVLERDPEVLKGSLFSESGNTYTLYTEKFHTDTTAEPVEFELSSAEKLLVYRVLECGVRYIPLEGKSTKTQREAQTILNARIENAKTGLVIWAGQLKGTASDEVPTAYLPALEKLDLKFYRHKLPNQ